MTNTQRIPAIQRDIRPCGCAAYITHMRRRTASPSFDNTLSWNHEQNASRRIWPKITFHFPFRSRYCVIVATPICRLSFWTNTRSTCFCCLVRFTETLPLITRTFRNFLQAMWDFAEHHMVSSKNWGLHQLCLAFLDSASLSKWILVSKPIVL